MNKLIPLIFSILIFSSFVYPQVKKENWMPIKSDDSEILYINPQDLNSALGDEFYVWVLNDYKSPISIEGIDDDIYQTKTYYLFSRPKKRYSILQMMFFDDENNILKSYSYSHDSDSSDYKYNAPVITGTDAETIFNICIGILDTPKN